MENLTKDSILGAIQKVDENPDIRNGRESFQYDLIYDGKKYPPILILSEANKILGGKELSISDFGESAISAFKILKEKGFRVIKKLNLKPLDTYKDKILKNNKMLTKAHLIAMVDLCKTFADGQNEGNISKDTYTNNFKTPFLDPFIKKHGDSPNKLIQVELKKFYNEGIKNIDEHLQIKNFGFWGNNIYSYVWTCIFYHFGNESLPASYSPQLYILVNKMGLKFGFCYGHQIFENDKMVQIAKNDAGIAEIMKLLKNDSELCFFNSSEQDITARPELLFGENERIIVNSPIDIENNWSNKSLLIKEFSKERIPENIGDIIQITLINLKDFYLSLLPHNEKIEMPDLNLNSNLIQFPFNFKSFHQITQDANLCFSEKLTARFVASLCTKPFVICTGLSGSGKTKLAQSFVQWICESKEQYKIVPVGADWTNREPLLGFPNGLDDDKYVFPDSGALQLMINALKEANENKPYFLILDEMNLSHVERYFADFLSIMESKDEIKLYSGADRKCPEGKIIDKEISWPKNLFVIGTVNVDETTYMFSPKVLDRANVIEFRVSDTDMGKYLESPKELNMNKFFVDEDKDKAGVGSNMASDFLDKALSKTTPEIKTKDILVEFFKKLEKAGAEFGYRSASEINRLVAILESLTDVEKKWDGVEIDEEKDFIDIAIMQKLLPKLHGSRNKMTKVLPVIGALCLDKGEKIKEEYFEKFDSIDFGKNEKIKYRLSFEKICRMYKSAVENGYTSYAEA